MSRSERSKTSKTIFAFVFACAFVVAPTGAFADDDPTTRARVEFVAATDHVKNARWGEALAAFERSAELRPHPLTTFNIGACERALGRYTRARATLDKALSANESGGKHELAPGLVGDAKKWIDDLERMS